MNLVNIFIQNGSLNSNNNDGDSGSIGSFDEEVIQ